MLSITRRTKESFKALQLLLCVIHGLGCKAVIHLNTSFAVIKFGMLWTIIGLGFAVLARTINREPPSFSNLDPKTSFKNLNLESVGGARGFARAYLDVIFSFGGFNQANYASSSNSYELLHTNNSVRFSVKSAS